MKISIITAVYNRATSIASAIASVQNQSYKDVEYVVIDGGSTDGTLEILRRNLDARSTLLSEPDEGIYDALNKGISRATGEIIGIMHSDDFYSDMNVLSDVALAFTDQSIDAVYGDLDYVAKDNTNRIIRRWRSGDYSPTRLKWGWMPPHPTLFLRRRVLDQWGGFDTRFRIAADYDAILRYFGKGMVRPAYISRVLVKMRTGGESNRSMAKILLKTKEDYMALKKNEVGGFCALTWKNLSKLGQFFASDEV